MNKLFIIILILLSGCLKLGDNVELAGKAIDVKTINRIEKITQIPFPEDTIHLMYYSFGDTIDPYWLYKGVLSKNGYLEIMANTKFLSYGDNENSLFSQYKVNWWHPGGLEKSISKKSNLSNGALMTYSIGMEETRYIIYISYHTI